MTDWSAAARYAGLAGITTLWATIGAGIIRSGFDVGGQHPLSDLVADPRARLAFQVGLVVGALCFVAFHSWVRHRYPVGAGFSVLMLVGMAAQAIAGLVRIDGTGSAHTLHTTSGLILGASVPLFMWRFAAGQSPGAWRRTSYLLFWLEFAACIVGYALSVRRVAAVAEMLPAVCFHLWIVVLTLHGAPQRAHLREPLVPTARAVPPTTPSTARRDRA